MMACCLLYKIYQMIKIYLKLLSRKLYQFFASFFCKFQCQALAILLLVPMGLSQANLTIGPNEKLHLAVNEILITNGNLSINRSGSLTGAPGAQMRVSGDWNNDGTFIHNDSQIYLTGAGVSKITGDNNFHSLIVDLTEIDTTGGKTVLLEKGVTQTVDNLLQLRGDEQTDLMVGSTQDGVNATVDTTNAEVVLSNVIIRDVDLVQSSNQLTALLEILEDSRSSGGANNANTVSVSLAQLELVATNIQSELLSQYQHRIAIEGNFSNPPTVAEVQSIIESINRVAKESLQNIFNNSGSGDPAEFNSPSVKPITLSQLQAVAIDVNPKLLAEYQDEIADHKDFSEPPTIAQVQALVDEVNNRFSTKALAEILEDSLPPSGQGNANGIAISLAQLQLLSEDINTSLLVQYQAAIANHKNFSDPPTLDQVQALVNLVNSAASDQALADILDSDNEINLEQLQTIANNVNPDLLEQYQHAIENKKDFSTPPTIEEVQTLIDQVNTEAHHQALEEILEDSVSGANNKNGELISLAQLQAISGLQNIQILLLDLYQQAIQEHDGFSDPVLVAEVQALIDQVNRHFALAMAEILEDSASTGGDQNANGITVSLEQLLQVGLVNIHEDLLAAYQRAIAEHKDFDNPPMSMQVQALVNKVNSENGRNPSEKRPTFSEGLIAKNPDIIDEVKILEASFDKLRCLAKIDTTTSNSNYSNCNDLDLKDETSITVDNLDLGDEDGVLDVGGQTYVYIDIDGDNKPDYVWSPDQNTIERVNLVFLAYKNNLLDKVSGYPLGHDNSLLIDDSRPELKVGGPAGHKFKLWGLSGKKFVALTEYITIPFSGQKMLTAEDYISPLDLGINMVVLKGSLSIPIPLVVPKDIKIDKQANRKQASVGDTVVYSVSLENVSSITQKAIGVTDKLPPGFRYVDGSARYNGAVIKPVKINDNSLHFALGDLESGAKHQLQYQLAIGSGVNFGKYTNTAMAVATLATVDPSDDIPISAESQASVKVVPSALFDLATIIGKVYHDRNGDGQQTKGEEPLPNVRLFTSAGQQIQVDQDGQYHLPNVIPGRMVIRLDETSLPVGASVVGRLSKLVDIRSGIPSKVNFGVQLPANSNGITPNTMVIRQLSDKPSPRMNLAIFGHAIVNPSSKLFVDPLEIYLHTNFAAFVNNWTVIIREEVNGKTVKTFTGSREEMFKPILWVGDSDNGMQTKPGQFSLQLKVTDQYNRHAITRKIPIILHAGEVDKKISNKTINVTREDMLLALPQGDKTERNDMRIKGKALQISGQGFNAININKDGNLLFSMPHLVPDTISANDVLEQGIKAEEPVTELILPRDKFRLTAILIKQQDGLSQIKQGPIIEGGNNE